MELVLIAITVLAHLLIPLAFTFWVGFSKATSRVYWLGVVVIVASYLFLMHIAGAGWHWFGFYWMYVFWVLFVLAVARFFRSPWKQRPWWPARKASGWIGLSCVVLVALFFLSAVPPLVTARSFLGVPVELRFPLRRGVFHIGHGGSNEAVNHHYPVSAQRYALDILELNRFGVRARGLWPRQLSAYAIYDADVLAPCDGEIVGARDGLPDMIPPEMDRENAAGNYIALHCNDVTVLLGHLLSGSIRVDVNERMVAGQPLAKVGNSGNTSEPHLHVHAVRGRQTDHEQQGWAEVGVPMLFDGRFLIRNDRIAFD